MGSRSIVGAALVWTACASAQELRLEELVSAALHSNAEILAAQKRYEAARQRPSQAASLPDPTFSPGWSSAGNPLPGAGLGTNPMSNIGFAVTQEIPYPGKQRLRGNIAAKEADVQFEELQLVQLGVISRVKQAFFRLHHAYSGREVLELSAAMHGLEVVQTMERIAPTIARLRLSDDIDNYAEDYSRGMKK